MPLRTPQGTEAKSRRKYAIRLGRCGKWEALRAKSTTFITTRQDQSASNDGADHYYTSSTKRDQTPMEEEDRIVQLPVSLRRRLYKFRKDSELQRRLWCGDVPVDARTPSVNGSQAFACSYHRCATLIGRCVCWNSRMIRRRRLQKVRDRDFVTFLTSLVGICDELLALNDISTNARGLSSTQPEPQMAFSSDSIPCIEEDELPEAVQRYWDIAQEERLLELERDRYIQEYYEEELPARELKKERNEMLSPTDDEFSAEFARMRAHFDARLSDLHYQLEEARRRCEEEGHTLNEYREDSSIPLAKDLMSSSIQRRAAGNGIDLGLDIDDLIDNDNLILPEGLDIVRITSDDLLNVSPTVELDEQQQNFIQHWAASTRQESWNVSVD